MRGSVTMPDDAVRSEWLDFVADLITSPPRAMPAEMIATRLCATFGLTGCSYTEGLPGNWSTIQLWPETQQFGGQRADVLHWTRHRAVQGHPILRYYLHTGSCRPMTTADVPPGLVGRRILGEFVDFADSIGSRQQIALPLATSAIRQRSFVMGRSEPFSPGEVSLALTLWRVLTGLDRLVDALAHRHRHAPADVLGELRLTARELAVLGLLAQGLTAAAIGRRLAIAERTVHKHLAHSYAKLRVGDRLSAVLRAQELGLVSVDPLTLAGRARASVVVVPTVSPGGR